MKKNKKVLIDKNNFNRVLLTEVLPYEVPIILNNEGFYKKESSVYRESLVLRNIFKNGAETYPFSYKIIKLGDDTRTLYLMHPSNQKDYVSFYKKYNLLICHLTQRSKFSLRAPSDVAGSYYNSRYQIKNNKIKDEDVEIFNDEGIDQDVRYASSFFIYKKYAFLYKFYDSYEFHRLEKRYKKLLKFDISKCFDNISTRRLAESIKEEVYAKDHKNEINFENSFINLMENSNFGRNDGILIGPEISRIFAEIILQRIDRNVHEKNASKEYEVRRYVDDYFLFYNDDSIGKDILKYFKQELEGYKLYLNESKIEYFKAPFLTGTSMAKKDLQDIFGRLFDTFDESIKAMSESSDLEDDDDEKVTFIKYNKNPSLAANKLIRDIKAIVINNETKFESIVGYFFTTIKNKLHEVDRYSVGLDGEQSDNIQKFIKVVIDVSFFVYSMDKRVRSTFLISQISILCYRIAKNLSDEYRFDIMKKLQDEMLFVIKGGGVDSPEGVELVNLIIVLGELENIESNLSSDEVCKFLIKRKLCEIDDLSYFNIVSILFFIKNKGEYLDLKNKIYEIVIKKLNDKKCSLYSESAHLVLDLISCPYIDKGVKKKIIQLACSEFENKRLTAAQMRKEYIMLSSSNWFVDWSDGGVSIERLLQKKELKSAYE